MIRDQWYVILESREVSKKMRPVKRMGEKLLLWRDEKDAVHCLIDRCCHRGVALSKGKLIDNHVQCPFHGLEYNGKGECTCIPANSKTAAVSSRYRVPSYPVYESAGWIWIWWGSGQGTEEKDDKRGFEQADSVSRVKINAEISQPVGVPEYFSDIDDGFVTATVKDPWKAHYSRVLENQLDVVHLPFVHHNTIGRGNRTVVDGSGIQWIGKKMLYTYVFNRIDDCTPPKRPKELEIPPADSDFKLEIIIPNLWQNYISKKLRIVAAFVPVDDGNTLLYLRVYQRFMKIPLIKGFVNWIFCRTNLFIAHQDRRVVETQVPKASSLKGGEQLIQGDLPIMEYRKKMESLLEGK